jgi:hypothetical protein
MKHGAGWGLIAATCLGFALACSPTPDVATPYALIQQGAFQDSAVASSTPASTVAPLRSSSVDDRFSEPAFDTWLEQDNARRGLFARFTTFLETRGVVSVVAPFELWRTASSAASCGAEAFVVPDEALWPNVVATLQYVRDVVQPTIGDVEVVSAFRDEALNRCARGAPRSAHRLFYAVDVIPLDPQITRATLIESLCRLHAERGAAFGVGQGFYSGTRFHVDTMRFRRWGPDGTSATSPCAEYD